ncbi:hypothetical protein J809_2109 [Acinetobacter sp. 25977_6]|uniref:hypothetical protein n=1 Tax=Acinetobacter calcoaceticus/baumannii complex TaxID=909768 RepID=UPI0004497548|nr:MULTISPECIES: hypothetical protein [Acinetobacter calcoaceticus/baumannii complex]KCZ33497.1 hypothetical protein J812_1201 [Acinetobacter baumannii 25977_9]EXT39432.1 hypothetical protein J811_1243 [Acinetobacter sp. 25977_8]EXT43540.1 hypothetical protein J810_2241 [Acinetobacter sp. 25977_7]EXT44884.1 hypothetical protein J809_2109 [Acinetobacter sp. 25977_6]EXT46499.1 hypothetical protein J807_3677 [Acinetobacter sp. 25977_4]
MSNVIRFRRNGLAHKISPQDVKQRLISPSKDLDLKKADQLLEIDFEDLPYDQLLDLARVATIDLLETDARYKKTSSAIKQIIHLLGSFLERRSKEEWKKYHDSMTLDMQAAARAIAFEEANNILPELAGSTFANVFANKNEVRP